jgi:hypothetical protein
MTDRDALESFLTRQLPTPADHLVADSRAESAAEILDEIGSIQLDYRNGITDSAVEFVEEMQQRLESFRAGKGSSSGWRCSQAQLIWLESIRERIS